MAQETTYAKGRVTRTRILAMASHGGAEMHHTDENTLSKVS